MINITELKEEIAEAMEDDYIKKKMRNVIDTDSFAQAALDVIQKYICIIEEGTEIESGDVLQSKTEHFNDVFVFDESCKVMDGYIIRGRGTVPTKFTETIKRADGRPVLIVEKESE